MEPLLTQDDVAVILNVKIRTLEDWRYRKRGPAYVLVGDLVRYRHADIIAYLEERTVKPR